MDLTSNMGEYQTKPKETLLFKRERVELFSGGRVSCCWVPKRNDVGWNENCMPRYSALGIFLRARVVLFTGGWVSCCWVPKRDDAVWSENYMPRCNALKNGHLPERKGRALYRRVSELLLSPKVGWRREWEEWLQDRRRK